MWPVSFKSKTILPFDYLSSVHTVKTLKHHSLIIDSLWWIVISCYRLKKAGIRTSTLNYSKFCFKKWFSIILSIGWQGSCTNVSRFEHVRKCTLPCVLILMTQQLLRLMTWFWSIKIEYIKNSTWLPWNRIIMSWRLRF